MTASRARLASRMEGIAPFHVMRILARARAMEANGRAVVHMEVGEPPFPTPGPVVAQARRALDAGETFYTPALGLPRLRAAIADYYQERFGVRLSSDRIVVTPGSSAGLQLALAMLCDAGSELLLTDPGYPCNRHFARLYGITPVGLPVSAGNAFLPTLEQIEAAWSPATRALLLASPANPTGSVIPRERLRAYAACIERLGGVLIVDEIYQGLHHGMSPHSVLEVDDRVVVVNSFSKYFCMTGWRVGWLVLPESFIEAADRLAQNMYLAAPTLAQHAAVAALAPATRPILEARREALGKKLRWAERELASTGLEVTRSPDGGFYLYVGLAGLPVTASEFCRRLLEEEGVAVTPGVDFGVHRAERHIRLACVAEDGEMRTAFDAIGRLCATLLQGG